MPRTTVGAVIERVRRQLDSSQRLEVNRLGATLDASETTATMEFDIVPALRAGALLSVGRELMRVISVNLAAKEVVVLRGWLDSDGTAHALGDEVLINPRFTRFDIYDALVDEVLSWSNDLYRVVGDTIAVVDGQQVIELPAAMANAVGVVRVYRNWTESVTLSDVATSWPVQTFRLQRGTPGEWDAVGGTGLLVRFTSTVQLGNVFVLVALPFDVDDLAETDDLVADVGMEHSMLEVLTIGIKYRLMGDAEHGRSGRAVQDEPRRAEETPPRSASDDSQLTFGMYQRRLAIEVQRLHRRYPVKGF
jgi:hypothetical protein